MINTGWESTAWQSDMQLMGKVAFSLSALFLLALAYRFYKSRAPQSVGISREDATGVTSEGDVAAEASPQGYVDGDTAELRLRRVKVTQTDPKHLVDDSQRTRELHFTAQRELESRKTKTGSESSSVTCGDQNDLKSTKEKDRGGFPDQNAEVQTQHGGEDDSHGNGACREKPDPHYRQDPEGKEMQDGWNSGITSDCSAREAQNVRTQCDIDVSIQQDHHIIHETHRFSSTAEVQLVESVIRERSAEDGDPEQEHGAGRLRGKIYSYHVASTSESVRERCVNVGGNSPQSSLVHLKTDTEMEEHETLQPGEVGDVDETDLVLITQPQKLNLSEFNEVRNVDLETRSTSMSSTPSAPHSLSVSGHSPDPTRDIPTTPATSTHHVSLSPGSVFDIHLNLENCYEVLSFAKKHHLDALKGAAYKVMSTDYLLVLQNPSVYGRLNAAERDLILDKRMKGRRYVVVADIDTQGYSSQNSSSLSYYDNDDDSWHLLSSIPDNAVSRGCSIATMFNYVFVALGSEGPGRQMKPSKRVFCYNPLTDSWKEISPLNEARPHCKLVALDGYLYAIGGECLHTVERYDPRQNRWAHVAPLPNDTFAVAHMATAYDDSIYVTGGTIRYMLLRYRPKENVWSSSIISGSKDRTTDMVAANNFLYRFDLNRSMGISVHRCNIRARVWYECASYPMPYPAPFQCAVIDNNIYCISRSFHLRFLAEDISPRFMDGDLQTLPSPKGVPLPLALILPVKASQ